MSRHSDPKTLSEAIENLESSDSPGFSAALQQIKELLEEVEPKIEKTIEKNLEEKPIATLGLTALAFLVIGYFFGRCGRR